MIIFFCADEEQRKSFLVRGYHPYINMGLPPAGVKMAGNLLKIRNEDRNINFELATHLQLRK